MKKISQLLTIVVLLSGLSVANGQLRMLSGYEKGSYHVLANDIKKVCGDFIKVDTIRDKISVTNNYGEVITERDTIIYQTTKSPFLNITTSGGSVDNYRQLKYNSADVTFMQYDVLLLEELKRMKRGDSDDKGSVQLLLPLGMEEIHLITRTDMYVDKLRDLKNLRVGIGTKQQGTNVTAQFIQEITGIQWFSVEYDLEKCFKQLLKDDIQAFFFVGSAPVKKFSELASLLKYEIRLVPIRDESLDAYYARSRIPAGTYNWSKEDIDTYAVKYALVTNLGENKEKRDMLYKLVSDVKTHLTKLQKDGHPKWEQIDFDFEGIDWEIHPVTKEVFGL